MLKIRVTLGAVMVACSIVAAHTRGGAQQCQRLRCEGDVNRDGVVTVDEIVAAVNRALGACTGCADIAGVWDMAVIGGAPNAFTYEFVLTLSENDDCSIEGTMLELNGESSGSTTVVGGSVSNQAIRFRRETTPTQQSYEAIIPLDGQTMGGTYSAGSYSSSWQATRRPEGTVCADISGVWDMDVTGGPATNPFTFEFELTLTQNDDCSIQGTMLQLNGVPSGSTTHVSGSVSNRAVLFRRETTPTQQFYNAKLLVGGRTMAGVFRSGADSNNWSATLRLQPTPTL